MELLRVVVCSCNNIQKIQLCVLCALLLTIDCTSVTDVASSQFGTFDFAELDEVLYDVELSPHPVSEQDVERTSGDNRVTMVSRHGQKYICSLPTISGTEDSVRGFESSKLPNVSALLLPLHKKPCLAKTIGWWTYEYCHGQFVRQYHLEAGKVMGKTVWLGMFHRETEWNQTYVDKVKKLISSVKNNIMKGYAMANHMTYYTNGTKCDLTGHPRTAVAKLYCGLGSRNKLVEVQERETCSYTLSIETPLLCAHPMFNPLYGNDPHVVTCSPLLPQQAYEEHMTKQELLRREKEKQEEEERQQKEAAAVHAEEESTTMPAGLSSSEQQLLTSYLVKSFSNLLGVSTGRKDFDLGSEFSDEDYLNELEAKADSQFQDTKSTELVKESSWHKGSDQADRSEGEGDVNMNDDKMNTEGGDHDGEQSMRTSSVSTHKSTVTSREVEGEESDKDVSFEAIVTRLFSNLLNELEVKDPKRTVPLHTIPKSISDGFRTEEEREMPGSSQSRDQLLEENDQRAQQKVFKNSEVSAGDRTDSSLQTEHKTSDLKKTVLSKDEGQGDSSTQRKKFRSLLLRKNDHEDYQDSESEEAAESELSNFIGELDEKALDDLAGELADELDDEELGEVLEQLDGEMLREVEEEVAENLQERFGKAGMKGSEVRVKILPMHGSNLLRNLLTEDDSEEEEGKDSTKDYGDSSSIKVKAVNKRSGGYSTLAESVSKLVDELFMDSSDEPLSEERKKQQKLESSYDQVWGDAQQKQKDKKPSR